MNLKALRSMKFITAVRKSLKDKKEALLEEMEEVEAQDEVDEERVWTERDQLLADRAEFAQQWWRRNLDRIYEEEENRQMAAADSESTTLNRGFWRPRYLLPVVFMRRSSG